MQNFHPSYMLPHLWYQRDQRGVAPAGCWNWGKMEAQGVQMKVGLPWLFVGLVMPVLETFFYPALAALFSPVQNIFFLTVHYIFQLKCPHRPASWPGSRAGPPVSEFACLRVIHYSSRNCWIVLLLKKKYLGQRDWPWIFINIYFLVGCCKPYPTAQCLPTTHQHIAQGCRLQWFLLSC